MYTPSFESSGTFFKSFNYGQVLYKLIIQNSFNNTGKMRNELEDVCKNVMVNCENFVKCKTQSLTNHTDGNLTATLGTVYNLKIGENRCFGSLEVISY